MHGKTRRNPERASYTQIGEKKKNSSKFFSPFFFFAFMLIQVPKWIQRNNNASKAQRFPSEEWGCFIFYFISLSHRGLELSSSEKEIEKKKKESVGGFQGNIHFFPLISCFPDEEKFLWFYLKSKCLSSDFRWCLAPVIRFLLRWEIDENIMFISVWFACTGRKLPKTSPWENSFND